MEWAWYEVWISCRISCWISGFRVGFLDFFWISNIRVGFLNFGLDFGFQIGFPAGCTRFLAVSDPSPQTLSLARSLATM